MRKLTAILLISMLTLTFGSFRLTFSESTIKLSKLHVSGNKIVDDNGGQVILRGVAYIDFAHADRSAYLDNDFYEISQEWHAIAVRLPIHSIPSDGYLSNWLDKMVNITEQYGMYKIIDCHIYDEQNLDYLKKFWDLIASRYANRTDMLFEIINEPTGSSWTILRQNTEAVIDAIRRYSPDRLIVINGLEYGYDIHYALSDPINRMNVIYGTHPYPNKLGYCGGLDATEEMKRVEWDRAFGRVAEKYPVLVTEFGWDLSNGVWGYGDNERYAYPLLKYLDERSIGYTAWSFSMKKFYDPALLSNWPIPYSLNANYTPSYSGEVIKQHLYQHNVIPEFPTFILLPLFVITTLITAVILRKRK